MTREPFQPKSLRPTSLGTPAVTMLSSEPPMGRVIPATKHMMRNEAKENEGSGGTGSMTFTDHLGNTQTLEWENGHMLTDGHLGIIYLGPV